MLFNSNYFNSNVLFRKTLPTLNTNIRILHSSPTAPAVDVYANNSLVAENLTFGSLSEYINLSAGEYTIYIYQAGTKDNPLFNKVVDLTPNNYYTAAAINLPGNLDLSLIQDANGSLNPSISFLRTVQLSPTAPLLDVSISNGRKLFKFLEYKEQSGYLPISPGIYDLSIFPSNATAFVTLIPNAKIDMAKFYTIYIIGLMGSDPQLTGIIVSDGTDWPNLMWGFPYSITNY